MKILVVFYSRTGNTKKVGEKIARFLNADVDEIVDLKDRKRKIVGWLISGRDAMKEVQTKIKFDKNPLDYDLVVVGTPTWAWTITPAIRTYLTKNKFKKISFFCTHEGNFGKVFSEMEKLSQKPVSTFNCKGKHVDGKEKEISEFCENLKKRNNHFFLNSF